MITQDRLLRLINKWDVKDKMDLKETVILTVWAIGMLFILFMVLCAFYFYNLGNSTATHDCYEVLSYSLSPYQISSSELGFALENRQNFDLYTQKVLLLNESILMDS